MPHRRIAWAVESDSVGFGKLLRGFGFAAEVEPSGPGQTRVRLLTYYETPTLRARLLHALVMRWRFRRMRRRMLAGLGRLLGDRV